MIETHVLVKVLHVKPIEGLRQLVPGRIHSMAGVESVSAQIVDAAQSKFVVLEDTDEWELDPAKACQVVDAPCESCE